MTTALIQLLEYQKPALESGQYSVVAEHVFKSEAQQREARYHDATDFVVSGPRFSLNPAKVRATYPPAGALGNFSSVFPHVALKTSTLPWERSAYGTDDYEPWLVLLLIDERDLQRGDAVIAAEPRPLGKVAREPGFHYQYQPSDADTDPEELVSTLKVRQSLLAKLMPTGKSLRLQAHVRRRLEADGSQREFAIVFSHRLPRAGASSLCFLVSVEGLYDDHGQFRHASANSAEFVELVHLTRWGFASYAEDGKDFEELVESIDTGTLVLPADNPSAAASAHLSQGAVPLWHEMRTTDRSWSWYRGPLSPVRHGPVPDVAASKALPVFADSLVTYYHNEGMFDVSLAAAFELGRALALNDTAFTAELASWKQRYNRRLLQSLEYATASELLSGTTAPEITSWDTDPQFTSLSEWMQRLATLSTVPFNYLVANDALLPTESLRFFEINGHWVDSLLAGAFSIGGLLREDLLRLEFAGHLPTQQLLNSLPGQLAARLSQIGATVTARQVTALNFDPSTGSGSATVKGVVYPIRLQGGMLVVSDPLARRRMLAGLIKNATRQRLSGVLVRSRLVSGWPDMMIDAFESQRANGKLLKNVRADRLSDDVLLLVFEGSLSQIEFYLKPEGLRFGLDEKVDGSMEKDVTVGSKTDAVPVTWVKGADQQRVVNIEQLARSIGKVLKNPASSRALSVNSATLAMHLFEGSSKGRFMMVPPA